MWFGASSRVALPVAKTDDSLSKVYLAVGLRVVALALADEDVAPSASSCVVQWPPGQRPPETSIMFAIAPPTKKPLANGWRMLRER